MSYELVTRTELGECKRLIAERFEDDADVRARIAPLPPGYFASGQYFDQPSRNQRGLHGTAAALRVLGAEADRDVKAREVAAGIVRYLEDRSSLELGLAQEVMANRGADDQHLQDEEAYWREKLRHDARSTVKQAELLYALGFTKHGVASADHLRDDVVKRLVEGQSNRGRGWAFLLEPATEPQPLPTAYVVRGLHANNHPVAHWADELRRGFLDRMQSRGDPREAQADCFILLVLLEINEIEAAVARKAFDGLWALVSPLLTTPAEARWNLYDGHRQNYVLVPWQMHLLALASRLRPWRRLASREAQTLLASVLTTVRERRSLNPQHDGAEVSTRSYAYVYDTVDELLSRHGTAQPLDWIAAAIFGRATGLRRWIGRGAWLLAATVLTAFIAYTIYRWATHKPTVTDIAANIIAAALVAAFGYLAQRAWKSRGHR